MRLILNEYGTTIKRKENRFEISNTKNDTKEEFSADIVKQIIISSGSSISSNVIKLAMKNDIDIVYVNKFGTPYARIYPCKLGGTTLTRRKQATQYYSSKAFAMVKNMIKAKISNQINLLKILGKTRKDTDFSKEIKSIQDQLPKLENLEGKIDERREDLLGLEGYSSTQYWFCLSKILPFKERQHEAKDPFNAMLNYGYGVLYSEVEKACIVAGLDPYLGFLHTDRYGKPSMVLDMIEEFRQPIVDRAVITLFARKEVDDSDFESSGNVFMLSQKGKDKIIKTVMERLHSTTKYNGKRLSLQAVVLEEARQVVRSLLEDVSFDGFVYKW